jgi:hypothetical protein
MKGRERIAGLRADCLTEFGSDFDASAETIEAVSVDECASIAGGGGVESGV